MHNTLNAWADKLQHAVLPALPQTVAELTRLSADDNVNMWNLARVVEKDPGLCIALLRRVNTGGQKRLHTEVTTVEHAMMMLGLTQLRTLPKAVPLIQRAGDAMGRERALRLMAQSYHAGWQARELARLRKDLEPDEVFLPALLHHLGEILLWLHAPAKMVQIEELAAQQQMEPEEAQYVVLGFGLDHLTLMLARRWGLPTLLQDSLKSENAQQPRVYGVMLAVQLARAAEQGWYRAATTSVLEQLADYLGHDFGHAAAECHRYAVEAARQADCYPTAPAATRLLYPGQPEAAPGWKPAPAPMADSATGAAPQPPAEAAAEGTAAFCLAPQLHILRRSLQELQAGMKAGNLTLQKILSLTMDGMHDGMGLNRVVFALLTQERHQLRARAIAGADNDPNFNRFLIELNGAHLFTRLLEKPQALWINDTNRVKFWPIVPKPFQRIIRGNSFFVLSVFVKERPVGLFYADRHTGDCALDGHAYHRFKQLGLLAAQAMGMVSGEKE
ncbi:MAG: HDOD domain-containing protein [Pseudomonadota bacterium]